MANLDEKQVAVARVYAQSMIDLAADRDEARSFLDELRGLREVLAAHPKFAELFASPLVDAAERRATLERVLRGRASDRLVDTLLVMDRHGRLGLFDTVVEVYRSRYMEQHGVVDVHVTSAVALTEDTRGALRTAVAEASGRKPNLVELVDPSLLGGLVVRFDDQKIDTSVAKDLRLIRDRLADRSAREIQGGLLAATER